MAFQTAFFHNATAQFIARYVSAATGIPVSVLLAQMSIETYYGTSNLYVHCHNPAGIKGSGACYPFADYPSYQAGAQGYAHFYLANSYYAPVLAVARSGASPTQVAIALGQSPWARSHYMGTCGSPGCQLVEQMQTYQLTQYDTPATTAATPPIAASPAAATVSWGYLILGLTGVALGTGALVLAVSPRTWHEFTQWEQEDVRTTIRRRAYTRY